MDRIDILLEPARAFLVQTGAFLPKVVLAVAILVAGWLIAKAVRFAVEKGLRAINFHILAERAGIDGFLRQGGIETGTTSIIALLFYWLAILAALMIAFNSLGLTYATDLVGRIALFIPKVIVAVLILAFGAYFARFVGATLTAYCRNIELGDADILGRLAGYAVMVFVILIALDQVNVGGDIIRQSFLIVLGAVAFALALAFGIAGQKRAESLLNRWWPLDDPARSRRDD